MDDSIMDDEKPTTCQVEIDVEVYFETTSEEEEEEEEEDVNGDSKNPKGEP